MELAVGILSGFLGAIMLLLAVGFWAAERKRKGGK